MKKLFFLTIAVCLWDLLDAQEIQVMSYNVRLHVKSDSANAWPFRKKNLASQVLYHETHLLGVQEALPDQMADLKSLLPQFKSVGVGREDGKEKGEYSAIFYDTTRLRLLKSSTFWLSETPQIPGSKSWDAAITRIVTWAQFRDRKSKKTFYAFNTHFDHMGKMARLESALLILKMIDSISGNKPVVLTGDFNSGPSEPPILAITDSSRKGRLENARKLSLAGHYGPDGTFNGFGHSERDDVPIDFIFLKGNWKVLKHATLSQTWKGKFPSDHFAVLATLKLPSD